MLRRITKRFKAISKKKDSLKPKYIGYCNLPLDDKLVLLEGGQGTNINGNMFSMLNELNSNERWSEYKTVFVVTEDTYEKAKARMKFYGFDRVVLSVRNSNEYCKLLATAKYLMTDNSFPPYFAKREGQVFLNTWHGTPLKTLGKSDKSNNASLANIQKNYLMSDYALFPNEFTKNVFMNDYDLENIFDGYSLIANYPRNYVFYDAQQGVGMKKSLGYENKKLFAYMPTWRGTGRTANTKLQLDMTTDILNELDKKLDDDTVVLVNLHFLLANDIDCKNYKHIEYFSSDYDTYEILNACDGLITDYSSVFFDFAVTGKKIVLYAYDKEKYLSSRGVYIPFESLPFPIVEDIDSLVAELNKEPESCEEFINEFCTNGCKESCEKLFELMVTGESDYFEPVKHNAQEKKISLIYAGALSESYFGIIKHYISLHPETNFVLAYRRNLNKAKKDFLLSLGDNASTLGTVTAFQFTFIDLLRLVLVKLFSSKKQFEHLGELFKREADRLLYSIKPNEIIDFSSNNIVIAGILTKLTGQKKYVRHGESIAFSKKNKKVLRFIRSIESDNGFEELDLSVQEDKLFCENNDGFADDSYRRVSRFKNILPLYLKRGRNMICLSMFRLKAPTKIDLSDTYITVGDKEYKPFFFTFRKKGKHSYFGIYRFSVPVEDVVNMPATNMVAFNYKNSFDAVVQCHIIYGSIMGLFLGLHGPITADNDTNTVAIFRQSRNNRLNIYVRSQNVSDAVSKRISQVFAFALSKLWYGKKAGSLVLLFEKNASKYEESASVLFEKLMDSGYKYAYFIISEEAIDDVPEKYRKNVLIKHSFKHYLYFFKAKSFIGTETMVHSVDLKTFNRLALMKIASKRKNYVFLQHGVMYMVSLDSEARKMFKRQNLKGKYRVVVSSQSEADHFVELGRHEYEDLYITGLPKFDKNDLNDDADKIVIMPTWRPWEINTARDNFLETSYFKMIMRIYDCVPENLKKNVIILPHPLIINELKKLPESVSDAIATDVKYDEILKQARILITDYSSIAYDAFYRGTRVIFYWEEKDQCMAQYGPTTKLMLNEENVYGDYFYSTDGLSEAIERNYNNPQTEEQKERYSKIVAYHDGKNTERLINYLVRDGIIAIGE